jgi:hypothetical protein
MGTTHSIGALVSALAICSTSATGASLEPALKAAIERTLYAIQPRGFRGRYEKGFASAGSK